MGNIIDYQLGRNTNIYKLWPIGKIGCHARQALHVVNEIHQSRKLLYQARVKKFR